jgi:CRISPR-associated exonuclease Cas4
VHDADGAQLCAQAMCLEEMLGVDITEGFLFYGQRKRRTTVAFDGGLRELVETTAHALHEMIGSRITPAAEYQPRRCDACSLIEFCQPKALRLKRGTAAWFEAAVKADHQTAFTGESEA